MDELLAGSDVKQLEAGDVIEGTIASSNGSATVAPMPRRNVRRGSAFLVMIIVTSSFEMAGS